VPRWKTEAEKSPYRTCKYGNGRNPQHVRAKSIQISSTERWRALERQNNRHQHNGTTPGGETLMMTKIRGGGRGKKGEDRDMGGIRGHRRPIASITSFQHNTKPSFMPKGEKSSWTERGKGLGPGSNCLGKASQQEKTKHHGWREDYGNLRML